MSWRAGKEGRKIGSPLPVSMYKSQSNLKKCATFIFLLSAHSSQDKSTDELERVKSVCVDNYCIHNGKLFLAHINSIPLPDFMTQKSLEK